MKVAFEGFSIFVHYQRKKMSMSFFPGNRFVSSFPDNGAKKMLFLSLYFKALKYTIKASEKIKRIKGKESNVKGKSDLVSQLSLTSFPLFLDVDISLDNCP